MNEKTEDQDDEMRKYVKLTQNINELRMISVCTQWDMVAGCSAFFSD